MLCAFEDEFRFVNFAAIWPRSSEAKVKRLPTPFLRAAGPAARRTELSAHMGAEPNDLLGQGGFREMVAVALLLAPITVPLNFCDRRRNGMQQPKSYDYFLPG